MKSCQFDSACDAGEQHYHRIYKHARDCIVLTDLIVSTATILEANRHAGTSFPTRIINTLHPTGGNPALVILEGITIEQTHASDAESIKALRLRTVHEIHASGACHADH